METLVTAAQYIRNDNVGAPGAVTGQLFWDMGFHMSQIPSVCDVLFWTLIAFEIEILLMYFHVNLKSSHGHKLLFAHFTRESKLPPVPLLVNKEKFFGPKLFCAIVLLTPPQFSPNFTFSLVQCGVWF